MPTITPTSEEQNSGTAVDDLLTNAPDWATFNIIEAHTAIDSNVTDLASAKEVMKKMATMIIVLRRLLIPELSDG